MSLQSLSLRYEIVLHDMEDKDKENKEDSKIIREEIKEKEDNKMSRYEIGHIQRRILTVLETIDERYITKENRSLRWLWMNVLVIMVYTPQQLEGDKKDWDWRYERGHHRRIWESVKGLEKRGLIETRIVTVKDIGFNPRFGKCQRWMEVRKK